MQARSVRLFSITMSKGLRTAYIGLLILAAAIALAALMSSCTTVRYVSVPEVHTDSIYIAKVQHDSVFQHDSIFTLVKGDTVTIYKERLRYQYKLLTDTVYRERVDSVAVPYEVRVEKQLSWIQRLQLETWPVFALLMLAAIGYWALKRYFS